MIKDDIFCVRIEITSLHDSLPELIPLCPRKTRPNAQIGVEISINDLAASC